MATAQAGLVEDHDATPRAAGHAVQQCLEELRGVEPPAVLVGPVRLCRHCLLVAGPSHATIEHLVGICRGRVGQIDVVLMAELRLARLSAVCIAVRMHQHQQPGRVHGHRAATAHRLAVAAQHGEDRGSVDMPAVVVGAAILGEQGTVTPGGSQACPQRLQEARGTRHTLAGLGAGSGLCEPLQRLGQLRDADDARAAHHGRQRLVGPPHRLQRRVRAEPLAWSGAGLVWVHGAAPLAADEEDPQPVVGGLLGGGRRGQ
mmetsp:Transcript_37279/g.115865  ORF Transcript_37279/g.115865 Transcript_37279/m.115865 type:complete len:259 (+) Transcript_37279:429-1205(+)